MHAYVRMHACVHVCMYVGMYVCMEIYMYIYIYISHIPIRYTKKYNVFRKPQIASYVLSDNAKTALDRAGVDQTLSALHSSWQLGPPIQSLHMKISFMHMYIWADSCEPRFVHCGAASSQFIRDFDSTMANATAHRRACGLSGARLACTQLAIFLASPPLAARPSDF